MAEQCMPFITEKTSKLLILLTVAKYLVYACYPQDPSEQYSSLLTTVDKFLAKGSKIKNSPNFISLILQKFGKLCPEQDLMFNETIQTLYYFDSFKKKESTT